MRNGQRFASGNLYINVNGVDYKLIEDISNALLSVSYDDLDNDTLDEVAYITVGFDLEALPSFQVRVYPRIMIDKTW